jgi:hypothetical protein|uniref:Uncharacterized protein n=1 Tax=viral metagenome TaxID=1070528 RepID=A0A6C0IZH2_9ZZZZ
MQSKHTLEQQPIGAGGFAAHTVGPAHVKRVVGGSGLNVETNPVVYHNEKGETLTLPIDGTFRPHQLQVVESFRRNPDNYVNTSFRMSFSKPMKHVRAIELMEFNLPNALSVPANREYMLLFGLYDPSSGSFEPQENLYHKSPFKTMMADDHNDPNVDRTSNPAWANALRMELSDYAIFRGSYDVSQPLQKWGDNVGYKRIVYFPTPISNLSTLELTLMDPLGNLYDMDPVHEWSAVLQIYSKQ